MCKNPLNDTTTTAATTSPRPTTTTVTTTTTTTNNETGSRSSCMRPSSDPPKMKNSTQTALPHFNFSVTAELKDVTSRLIILINEEINEANCMVRNSAKLDHRTKQHTQFGVSTSDGSRDMARTKSWQKKKKSGQNHIASPTGIANNNETGSRSPCMRLSSDPRK